MGRKLPTDSKKIHQKAQSKKTLRGWHTYPLPTPRPHLVVKEARKRNIRDPALHAVGIRMRLRIIIASVRTRSRYRWHLDFNTSEKLILRLWTTDITIESKTPSTLNPNKRFKDNRTSITREFHDWSCKACLKNATRRVWKSFLLLMWVAKGAGGGGGDHERSTSVF